MWLNFRKCEHSILEALSVLEQLRGKVWGGYFECFISHVMDGLLMSKDVKESEKSGLNTSSKDCKYTFANMFFKIGGSSLPCKTRKSVISFL